MAERDFDLNEKTLSIAEDIGAHMPGGFLIYKAQGDEELLYANQAVFDIFGCRDLEEFKELTGFTFKGMLYPEDYEAIRKSINEQIRNNEDDMDYVVYRIVRKDGAIRWVDDYGHFVNTKTYGGVYYVFISDITEKRQQMDSDLAMRNAVIEALSEAYHTVWLINDIDEETFSLYRGDIRNETEHGTPIMDALGQLKYSLAKEYYIKTTVAKCDQERLQKELSIDSLKRKLLERPQYNINYLRVMSDGSERYFRIEFAKLDMPGGKMGVVCGFKDVDRDVREGQALKKALAEGKKAEEENLRLSQQIESAAKLADLMGSVASLLSNMPAMSFSKDAETGVYLACNQAFAEYAHKQSPEGVVGLTDHEIFDKETADHFVEDDQKALQMDEPYIFFEDVPDAAGSPRSLQTTKLKFVDASGRLCTLGMCVDVTQISKAKLIEAEARVKQQELEQRISLQEELLKKEEERAEQTRLITALASDYRSVYYIDLDKDEGVCYQAYEGLSDAMKAGDHFSYRKAFTDYAKNYISEKDRKGFLNFIRPDKVREGLKENRIISYRYLINRNGKESYEMIRFAGVRHPEDRDDHQVHAVSACFSDIDAETRKDLDQARAMSEALKVAKQANVAKTTFLSNMSHEIRTPMNAIIGLNNIALNDPETPDKTKEYLNKIGTSANHLLSIINDILDMSRIESGRMVIRNEEFSFSKVLEQVNTIISGQCREKQIDYDCRMIGNIEERYIGDQMKLRQILINILGNAVKFTPSRGKILFTIEELNRFEDKTTLRFVMSDTGIGMSKEYLPHIFESFSQEDTSSANRYGSTGLGMPITKNIVELMNGHIEVESEKGVGSTFTVTITFDRAKQKEEDALQGIKQIKDLRVLVIDDDPIALEHARIILGKAGVSCETASCGQEGINKVKMHEARRNSYDLILVDWKMPELDGLETTKLIREVIGRQTAIIILTSYNWEDIEDQARTAGVDSFVSKPLFINTLMDEFRIAYKNKNSAKQKVKADLNGRRILLAEDVKINAEIMEMVLLSKGMSVETAENGKIALELFESHEENYYDAILMDMRMPVMDGLEATRKIRASDKAYGSTVPIIALTANAFDEDVQRSMQAGLNAHLSKPIDAALLYETLENLIR